jgi:putative CocE/NonD family hydrolase
VPRVIDPLWIPLPDGCRLAARVWLPDDAEARPTPVILEAIPYRRRDGTLTADQPRYDWWARHGFAGVRVDIRGSGDSDGLLYDEYLSGEQDDAVDVVAWLAEQPWCDGRVGMIGYSWGGFAGLQVAARRPPALRAVVTINSTVRRYTDDCHYTGGSVNSHDMLSWATTMLTFDARPPDPAVVGQRWREMWERRLEVAPPMIERWLSHQTEDAYWRHGSVAFEMEAIACPVLAVGGWADPYRNAVLELLSGLETGRVFGIIGPWAHGYPHVTRPGPMIGFLGECARFFGRYLRRDDNGYDETPALRAYVQDFDPPAPSVPERSGRWVAVARWPPESAEVGTMMLRGRSLASESELPSGSTSGATVRIRAVQHTGLTAGSWCPYGGPTLPRDQRPDDALSLCFDSEALQRDLKILGFSRLRLAVAADRPRALIAARLCDVAPDGTSLLVTRGILNLTHREGHDRAIPIPINETMHVEVRLDCAGHRFAAGHRLRLALSPAYWPWVWPAPETVELSVNPTQSALELPLLGPYVDVEFEGPEAVTEVPERWITQSPFRQTIRHELPDEFVEFVSQPDYLAGRRRLVDENLEAEDWGENVYRIRPGDPLSAEVVCRRRAALGRDGWETRVEANATMRAGLDAFVVFTELRGFENGHEVAVRRFETRVPRLD